MSNSSGFVKIWRMIIRTLAPILGFTLAVCACRATAVGFPATDTPEGYIGRLLINEAPFPGERGFVSEADSKASMAQILWVLECRIHFIPAGYRQREIALVDTSNVFDVITAGGARGQVDGFFRDAQGRLATVPRVEDRLQNLIRIASRREPGRFARLLNYGAALATEYVRERLSEPDRFAGLAQLGSTPVTGRAYSWMTDRDYYRPGGSYLRIPDQYDGVLGGNRFFTLKKRASQ
jgi:hypothetical protein